MKTPPVLILFFNRPEPLETVLKSVVEVSPERVYLACDGPRVGREDDREGTEACKRIAIEQPWRSAPKTRFLERNLGCGRAVSEAISWFFEQEPEGIVLEDDCVPHATFFRFASEMLERYREDERVMSIDGSCFDVRKPRPTDPSYRFIRSPHYWGWASWARAWRRFRPRLDPAEIERLPISQFPSPSSVAVMKWRSRFRSTMDAGASVWGYQWSFAHFVSGGLVASPARNLVTNIWSTGGAHIRRPNLWQDVPLDPMPFPLKHPPRVEPDERLDRYLEVVQCNHRPWVARKFHQLVDRHGLLPVSLRRRGYGFGSSHP